MPGSRRPPSSPEGPHTVHPVLLDGELTAVSRPVLVSDQAFKVGARIWVLIGSEWHRGRIKRLAGPEIYVHLIESKS